ncbi:MAG: hypothetical protein II399_01640 [Lachnospiraceae bacterium]|nr:hypothetical protein [Lachnospiraceae bacterium]
MKKRELMPIHMDEWGNNIYFLSDKQCDFIIDVLKNVKDDEKLYDQSFSWALFALINNIATRESFEDIMKSRWERCMALYWCIEKGLCVHPIRNLENSQMHLMQDALELTKIKGHPLSEDEQREALKIITKETHPVENLGDDERNAFRAAVSKHDNISNGAILAALAAVEQYSLDSFRLENPDANGYPHRDFLFSAASEAIENFERSEIDNDDGER